MLVFEIYNFIKKGRYHKLFQKVYGCGVVKIIREDRIKRAKELLLNSKLSVSDVAAQIGILDANYFTRMFKAETGTTPKNFRNQV